MFVVAPKLLRLPETLTSPSRSSTDTPPLVVRASRSASTVVGSSRRIEPLTVLSRTSPLMAARSICTLPLTVEACTAPDTPRPVTVPLVVPAVMRPSTSVTRTAPFWVLNATVRPAGTSTSYRMVTPRLKPNDPTSPVSARTWTRSGATSSRICSLLSRVRASSSLRSDTSR